MRHIPPPRSCTRTYDCSPLDAAREPDASFFLSLKDAGAAEDVGGLPEEAADDGRSQRTLCGPDARPREPLRGRRQGRH